MSGAPLIEEVGARLVLMGKAAYLAGMREARTALGQFAADAKTAGRGVASGMKTAEEANARAARSTVAYRRTAEAEYAKVSHAAAGAFKGLAIGAAVGVGEAVKSAATFQQKMTLVHTMAKISTDRIAGLSQGLLKLSPQVALGPNALADALYRIASSQSGLKTTNDQLLAMTKAAAQLVKIGGPGTDLEQTARILGGVQTTGIKGAGSGPKKYQNIVALSSAIVGAGDMRMQDLVNAYGTGVLANAGNFGLNLQDVGAAIALEGDNIMSGQVSGHALAHMFSLMGAPSGVASKAYNAIGLGTTQIGRTMRGKGLGPALAELQTHLSSPLTRWLSGAGLVDAQVQLSKYGLTPAEIAQMTTKGADSSEQALLLTKMFGGAKQSIPIVTLLREQAKFGAKRTEIGKSMGTADFADAWKKTTETAMFQWQKFVAEVQVLGIKLGTKLLPTVTSAIHELGAVLAFAAQHAHELEVAGALLLGIWTVRKFGSLALAVQGFATKLGEGTSKGQLMWQAVKKLPDNAGEIRSGLSRISTGFAGITGAITGYEVGASGTGYGGGLIAAASAAAAGFTMAGPWGAAVAGFGTIASFMVTRLLGIGQAASQASQDAKSLADNLTNAYKADQYRLGQQSKDAISGYLQTKTGQPQALALAASGVNMGDLINGVRADTPIGGTAFSKIVAAFHQGLISPLQEKQALDALQTIDDQFNGMIGSLDAIAQINGQTTQHAADLRTATEKGLAGLFAVPLAISPTPTKATALPSSVKNPPKTTGSSLLDLYAGLAPHHAGGGMAFPGWHMFGENGPELGYVHYPTSVVPSVPTGEMLAGHPLPGPTGVSRGGDTFNFYGPVGSEEEAMRWLRQAAMSAQARR